MLRLRIHPDNPQDRLIEKAAEAILNGAVVVYPTDTAYALGCIIGQKKPLDRIISFRQIDSKHLFTLLCQDLSQISDYAIVDRWAYRTIKAHTPGPYTFVMQATKQVPKQLMQPKRKTIGIRVVDHPIMDKLLGKIGQPLMSTTLQLPNWQDPLIDPDEMAEVCDRHVDLLIDAGWGEWTETSVVDLSEDSPVIIREGKGDVSDFDVS